MQNNFVTNIGGCIESATQMMMGHLELVYYSHIPVAIISVIIGLFVIFNNKKSVSARAFFALSIVFSLWVISSLVTWVSSNSAHIMFFWSLFGILDYLLFVSCLYLVYTYKNDRDLPFSLKIFLAVLFLPILVMTPLSQNISYFDYGYCAPQDNLFAGYLYHFLAVVTFVMVLVAIYRYVISPKKDRAEILLMCFGSGLFLFSIFGTQYISDILERYDISTYGVFSMPLFIAFIAYLIVKFKAFNVKLLGAQALVISLIALIGSQFLFIQSVTAQILTAVTLIISGWIGLMIIRSVKLIDKQKEELEEASQQKSEFMSFAAHQIRTPVTIIKGYAANLLDGDYGELAAPIKKEVQKMLISSNDLIYLIADYLDKAKMELNQLKYAMNPFDLKALVTKVVSDFRTDSEHHNIPVNLSIAPGDYTINADENKIKQIIGNLIDNSIKYNVEGGHVDVNLERDEAKKVVRISVADNGKGIAPETMPHLFEKFGRASNVEKTTISGTGLGLYLAKQMLDAHNGTIRAESEGLGKGSKFIVELPFVAPAPVESSETSATPSTSTQILEKV